MSLVFIKVTTINGPLCFPLLVAFFFPFSPHYVIVIFTFSLYIIEEAEFFTFLHPYSLFKF